MPKPIPLCDIDTAAFSFQEALERLLEATDSIDEEEKIAISEAVGRFLSRDVITGIDFPAFRNSAMDGYALRAEDALPGAHVTTDHDVFQRSHLAKQTDILKGARDADPGDFMWRGGRITLAGQLERAGIGLIQAGDDIEERGFTGAVGADETVNLATLNLHADPG